MLSSYPYIHHTSKLTVELILMASMGAQQPLRIFFIPFLTPGHMIPMLDIAKLFARRGAAATIITTPGNEQFVRPTVDHFNSTATSAVPIDVVPIPFPSTVTHLLPNGKENLGSVSSSERLSLYQAFIALQGPFAEFILAARPDCLISDAMFMWTADTAAALGVPRLAFYGPGIFVHCVHESLETQIPRLDMSSDSESFVVDGLPRHVEMTRSDISGQFTSWIVVNMLREGENKSYGVIVNSFYELERDFADHYRRKPGRRAYYVGPVSLSNCGQEINNGVTNSTTEWLDSKERDSVLYVSFGSLNEFSDQQLRELAVGLENSGHNFVWAVKNSKREDQELLPTGFEERVKGKGLVMRGWAPQVVILNHPAVGGFLTHCGWNSTLESVSAGVPMVTWPVEYDQFLNEKLITEILEIGVRIERKGKEVVKAEEIAKAVKDVMGEEKEAEERRERVRMYAAMAKAAVEEGGSSYRDIDRLMDEISAHGNNEPFQK